MRYLALALFSAAWLVVAPARAADPPSGTVGPGGEVTWQGEFYAAGANTSNFAGDQTCAPSYPGGPNDEGAVPGVHACDVFELTVDVPGDYWATHKGGVNIDIEWESADNDFDMYVFRKPPAGEPVGPPVASSAAGGTDREHVQIANAQGTYLVRVNPFAVAGSDYSGKVGFFTREPIPSVAGGVDQFRASSTGYLSYSEPHISVNPRDPAHLVAGSKMYQNLEEYLFKIGTFVSFDGGRTWRDNGHLPGYPAQRGDEGADYYVTSDIWTAFDDEGNAYAMVLDHPPGSLTGAGWGMTLHKSTDGGRTWSDRIPIHENQDPVSELLFLDDKNTLAVDNFGPDGDGRTGNMYACWSFDAPVANLAVFVSRSTDGGASWSDPVNASAADRTVIGCHVVVGPPQEPGGPGVVYVFWNDFSGGGEADANRIRMSKSTDGGESFSSPSTVVTLRELPSPFPNSGFRNLSIPAAAIDPNTGAVHVSYADYHATKAGEPCPPDEEAPEGQVCDADVMLVSSTDGGESWGKPVRVNQDAVGNGRDQFQQQLAVTPSGQLTMMWFDRRHDPQNFYIDTFFARSGDAGATWSETRVTKSMWDPSINPPISPSGEFIGDYQGLAATDCSAVPFWQDTTLANLPATDPRRSPYQEAFAASIPNTPEFGGPGLAADCPAALRRPAKRVAGKAKRAAACARASGFRRAGVRPRGRRVRFIFSRTERRPVGVDVFQSSTGRRIVGNRKVASFRNRRRSFTWSGRANRPGRRVRDGVLFVRYRMRLASGRRDVRRVTLRRRDGRFRRAPSFYRRRSCGLVSSFKLTRPAFGGRHNRRLGIAFRLTERAHVTVQVVRAGRVVTTLTSDDRPYVARRTHRLRLRSEGLTRGIYRIRLQASSAQSSRRVTATLAARRL